MILFDILIQYGYFIDATAICFGIIAMAQGIEIATSTPRNAPRIDHQYEIWLSIQYSANQ